MCGPANTTLICMVRRNQVFLRPTFHGPDTTEGGMTVTAGFNGEKYGEDGALMQARQEGTEVRTEQTPEKLAAGNLIESNMEEPTMPQAASTAQGGTLQAPVNGSSLVKTDPVWAESPNGIKIMSSTEL